MSSLAVAIASMSLSDDPRKLLPEFVLSGDKSNLVEVSPFFISHLLSCLEEIEGKLDSFSLKDDFIDKSCNSSVEVILGTLVVPCEGILFVVENGIKDVGLVQNCVTILTFALEAQ